MKTLLILILFITHFHSQSQNLVIKQKDSLLKSEKKAIIFLNIENVSRDTIYFSNYYSDLDINFNYPPKVCAVKLSSRRIYPVRHTIQSSDTTYCEEPLIKKDLIAIHPGQIYTMEVDLSSFLCESVKSAILYEGTFTLTVTPKILKYCPKIWTGKVQCQWKWQQ